ncbi:hypothetical protein ACIQK5_21535 [Streptomyces virginiae]|uniref:hypothetical protein n=1 Tax=Streptomyces TaxID=1883 RepID=UPI00136C03F5|nr:hypothetical protein [Streptomyces sp. SID1046]MYV78696.1 hypothetical protein [Streptomyces sp. SID1046]
MRIRRTFAAVIATAALAGLGLAGAAAASAAPTTPNVAVTENPTPGECIDGGGKIGAGNICVGGTRNGEYVD